MRPQIRNLGRGRAGNPRFLERGRFACRHWLTVETGAVTIGAGPAFFQNWLVYYSQNGHAVLAQSDQGAERGAADNEGFGPVDRVQNPCVAVPAVLGAVFFAQNPVLRAAFFDDLA